MRAAARHKDTDEDSQSQCRTGVIEDTEWNIFLQGPIMANMLDEETLDAIDGD